MKRTQGFTLIEVLIAMMILAGALIALSTSWSGSALSYRKSKKIDVINTLLQQKMTEFELQYAEEFPTDDIEEAGEFEGNYPGMSWKLEIKALEFPDLTPMLASEDGGVDEMTRTVVKQMTDFFSQAVKEMRVTVVWSTNGRTLDYSATTYLVNYDQNLQLGGP